MPGATSNKKLVVLPYYNGVSEELQKIFSKMGCRCVLCHVTPLSTHNQIMDEDKCGVIYNIKCQDCDAEYVRETTRRLGTRPNEHRKSVQASDFKWAFFKQLKSTGQSNDQASID